MKIERFIENLEKVLHELQNNRHEFESNMKHLKKDNLRFSEWMMMYLAWSELGSEKDCAEFYWYLENEDEDEN